MEKESVRSIKEKESENVIKSKKTGENLRKRERWELLQNFFFGKKKWKREEGKRRSKNENRMWMKDKWSRIFKDWRKNIFDWKKLDKDIYEEEWKIRRKQIYE